MSRYTVTLSCEAEPNPLMKALNLVTISASNTQAAALQVKGLELQQDAARRAIAAKEEQLKPLDAQVKERNRQAASLAGTAPMLVATSSVAAESLTSQDTRAVRLNCGMSRKCS